MTLSPIVEFAPFRLDLLDERLWRGQEVRPLTPKAFAVLRCLVAHPGQLVTKDTLMDTVWPETAISESTLTGCIWEVRQALGDSARHPHYLETVHGRGYRFIALVTELAAPEAAPLAAVEQPQVSPVPALPVAYLVGRESELSQLAQWYETARQGQRQVGLIGGEPGIGKSALVAAFVAQVAAKTPVWIAHGQCIEQYGTVEPYLPLLEALGRLCRTPDGDEIVAVLRQVAPSWLVHLPAAGSASDREALARLASGVTPARMMRELAEALEVLTATRPMLLVLEDLHWSGPPTLEWVHYVARRRDSARLLVVGTYRPVEAIVRKHPLQRVRAELRQLPQCQELALDYLSEAAVAAYLTQRFGALPQLARLARILHQRTNGNPLFLTVVIDELISQQILHKAHEAWRVSGGFAAVAEIIPESLKILIEQHVEQLSLDDQHMLEAASVAGIEFTAAAVAAGLAQADEKVGTQRGEFDEGLTLGAEAMRIAETGAFPTSQCAAYASLADAFLVRGAFPSAIALLERGLDVCRRWHNLDWFPEYAASLGLAYAQGGRLAEALPLLEQAVAQETTMGGGHRAIGLTALSHGYRLAGRLEAARTQAESALSLACERQERGFQAWALRLLGEIAAHDTLPKIEPARAAYQQALALANELGMRPLQAHCHRGLGTLYRQTGQSEQARAELSTAIEMYREMAMTFWLPETEAALTEMEDRRWKRERTQQRFASLSHVVNELEETEVEWEFLL